MFKDLDEIRNEVDRYNKNSFEVIDNSEVNREFYKILLKNEIIELDHKTGKLKKLNKNKVVVGKLVVKSMFGFVLSDEDLYIHNPSNYFESDIVVSIIDSEKSKKKTEGKILDYLYRPKQSIIAKVKKDKNLVGLKEQFASYQVKLKDREELSLFKEGQIIELDVLTINKRNLITKFKKVISSADDPDLEMKIVLASHSIEVDFSQETLDETSKISEPTNADFENRVDLTNELVMTIDGADSKDLDDAIHLVKEADGIRLTVSIADVSHYIPEGSALDDDAYSRATSVYFVDRVVPMIPRDLSNGICSLHPNVDRLTISCEMLINKHGEVTEHKIFPSVINSKYRLTYDEVNNIIAGNTPEHLGEITGIIHEMNRLKKILNKKRLARGSFNLEDKDAKFKVDDTGKIIDITPFVRRDAEKLIEEFMILANETVAEHISWMELPFIYRVHDQPNPKKLRDVLSLFSLFGIQIKGDVEEFKPQMFKQALDQLEDDISKRIVSDLIVRSLSKARYQRENTGHFGLASKFYTHFTSPIRRYPDLIVHRNLRKYLFDSNIKFNGRDESLLDEMGAYTSEKEVNAIRAEHQIEDMKKAEYMKQFVNEEFIGVVASIMDYGFFIELDNTVRGLIRFDRIKEYTKSLNHKIHMSDKSELTIGSKVVVILKEVNIARGIVEFDLKDYTMIEAIKRTRSYQNKNSQNKVKSTKSNKAVSDSNSMQGKKRSRRR